MTTDLHPVMGVPPFVPVQTRGEAVASRWWLETGGDLSIAPDQAATLLLGIVRMIDEERSMIEQEIRQSIGLFIAEREGQSIDKGIINVVLNHKPDPEPKPAS